MEITDVHQALPTLNGYYTHSHPRSLNHDRTFPSGYKMESDGLILEEKTWAEAHFAWGTNPSFCISFYVMEKTPKHSAGAAA